MKKKAGSERQRDHSPSGIYPNRLGSHPKTVLQLSVNA
jgi:hypothetical protein